MALSDRFIPEPAVNCPRCGDALRHWRGSPEGARLRIWQQGQAAPVGQEISDPAVRRTPEHLAACRLPQEFSLWPEACACGYGPSPRFVLRGRSQAGVWRTLSAPPELICYRDAGDGCLRCPVCLDVVEARRGWRLYICEPCGEERWFEARPDLPPSDGGAA